MIIIEGKKYKVTETLGFQQVGFPAKAVQTENGERIAVKRGAQWVWWTIADRTLEDWGNVSGKFGLQNIMDERKWK